MVLRNKRVPIGYRRASVNGSFPFTSARKRHIVPSKVRKPIGTTARTGERCPESGIWQVTTQPSTTAPIAEHNVMPPYGNQAVTWRLIQHA
jgi:hypothetical protein